MTAFSGKKADFLAMLTKNRPSVHSACQHGEQLGFARLPRAFFPHACQHAMDDGSEMFSVWWYIYHFISNICMDPGKK
jgi:hypothetical protein